MFQIGRNDRDGAHWHAAIKQGPERKISTIAALHTRGSDRFMDIGTCGKGLIFRFEAALGEQARLVHHHVDRVLTRERSLPPHAQWPPALFLEPGDRLVRDLLI